MRPCLTMTMYKRVHVLTPTQREVMLHIQEFIEKHNYPPTIRELSERRGVAQKSAHNNLIALEKKGYISVQSVRPRGIKVLRPMPTHVYLAERDVEELGIMMGDRVSVYNGAIIGITRKVEVSSA